jgi:FkbM family methyltransferase
MTTIYLVLGCLIVWVAALSAYVWNKSRILFSRQSRAASMQREFREEEFLVMRLEVERHKRLLELQAENPSLLKSPVPPRFTSQFGEDLVLYEFFKNRSPGFYIEAGAYDGVSLSNTYLLESLGWKGLLVEPHPGMAERCRKMRPGSIIAEKALGPADAVGTVEFYCADDPGGGAPLSFIMASQDHLNRCAIEQCQMTKVKVEITSLDRLLDELTETVDFMSLDVEGMELDVLKGFNLSKYQPSLILVEQNWSDSDRAVSEHLARHGYFEACTLGCNAFFSHIESVESLRKLIQLFKGKN